MIDRLITTLQQAKLIPQQGDGLNPLGMQAQLWDEDIADVLWLAAHITADATVVEEPEQEPEVQDKTEDSERDLSGSVAPAAPPVPIHLPQPERPETSERSPQPESGLPIQVKAAPALPDVRNISRALRPLMQKVPSRTKRVLDEAATINRIADQDVWIPVLKPERERWLTLELVIEASPFGFIWEETLREFQEILEYQGAFRNVRTWWLKADARGQIRLGVKARRPATDPLPEPRLRHHPRELVDGSGRTLVLLVSDCRSPLWQQRPDQAGQIYPWLQAWSRYGPAAVVQLLPESLWRQTELDRGYGVQLGARQRGATHGQLLVRTHNREANRLRYSGQPVLPVPIVTLSAAALKQWALVVAAASQEQMPGRLFDLAWLGAQERPVPLGEISPMTPEQRVELFEATASPIAQRLAKMMAAVPVSLPVVHLIQKHLLWEAEAIHIAEVCSSGLLQAVPGVKGEADRYDFVPGVRELLNLRLLTDETFAVLDRLSENIAETLGLKGVRSFAALLSPRAKWTAEIKAQVLPFAQVATQVLYNLGGEYAAFAEKLVAEAAEHPDWPVQLEHQGETVEEDPWVGYPPLQWFEFELGTLVRVSEPLWQPEPYAFEVGWLEVVEESSQEAKPSKSGQKQQILEIRRPTEGATAETEPEIIIRREPRQGWQYREPLAEGLTLDLVEIPAGTFLMGSPEDELEAYDDEKPQHEVTVAGFWLGKYPVTQAQWRFVAGLPVVNQELEPDPSHFKGEARPVEQVSWEDAQEFCARLSVYTGRGYRLPSEAEWEYAARAGTTTPFYFGETIDAELANYQAQDWEYEGKTYPGKYGRGRFGEFRKQTTEPGSLNAANAWGLHDMHGNVWEWCQDHWHGSYEGAPTDGTAWIDETLSEKENRVLRGGSWNYNPRDCRSACRNYLAPGTRDDNLGFRVVVSLART